MKKMIKIIFMMAGIIALPAIMHAQSSLNVKTKTSFLQNPLGMKKSSQSVNATNATTTTEHLHGKSQAYLWDSASNA